MKNWILMTFFLFLCLFGLTQNINEKKAKEIFGYRFISSKEAGFSKKLEINLNESDVKYDQLSWLIPLSISGVLQYALIQPRYSLDLVPEMYDTLSLIEAKEAIMLLTKIRPCFPNEEGMNKPYEYFYMTKEKSSIKSNLDFRKAISCDDKEIISVDLPENISSGVIESNMLSYLVKNEKMDNVLGFEVLPFDFGQKIQYVYVLRLIYLK